MSSLTSTTDSPNNSMGNRPSSTLYLCLDCGGSKTAAAIADQGGYILSRGYGGPSNFKDVGLPAFVEAVKAATIDAIKSLPSPIHARDSADLPNPSGSSYFEAVWVGASGIDKEPDVQALTPHLSSLFSIPRGPRLLITNDAYLLASPLMGYPSAHNAIAVIGGTGSNVMGLKQQRDGQIVELGRIGGWGWILGDEGSGFHVGKHTVQWMLAESDRSAMDESLPISPLQRKILSHFEIASAPELLSVVYGVEPTGEAIREDRPKYLRLERKHRLSSLTPLIFDSAFKEGDEEAISILQATSGALAGQIRLLITSSKKETIDPAKTILCFGGSLVGVQEYRDLIVKHLAGFGMEFVGVEFVADPAPSGATGLANLFEDKTSSS